MAHADLPRSRFELNEQRISSHQPADFKQQQDFASVSCCEPEALPNPGLAFLFETGNSQAYKLKTRKVADFFNVAKEIEYREKISRKNECEKSRELQGADIKRMWRSQKLQQKIDQPPAAQWYGWRLVQDTENEHLDIVMSRREMAAIFIRLDADQDGLVNGSGLRALALSLGQHGWSKAKESAVMREIDTDEDGLVSFEEVYKWYSEGGLSRT